VVFIGLICKIASDADPRAIAVYLVHIINKN
jgi:hypothetical protein